jgi:lipid-binding SYLF domain-containing protein
MKGTFKSAAHVIIIGSILLGSATLLHANEEDTTEVGKRLEASAELLNRIMSSTDKSIPAEVLAEAKCIAVIPSLVKVALGVGGRHGKGVATCRTNNGWSAPGPIRINGGSIGIQIGTQKVGVVLVVLNESAFRELLLSRFKIGAEVAGSPGPIGKDATSNEWRKSEILTYSQSQGVFAGVNFTGAAVKQDKDAIVELYGRYIPIGSILAGKVPPPAESHDFLATVRKCITRGQHA